VVCSVCLETLGEGIAQLAAGAPGRRWGPADRARRCLRRSTPAAGRLHSGPESTSGQLDRSWKSQTLSPGHVWSSAGPRLRPKVHQLSDSQPSSSTVLERFGDLAVRSSAWSRASRRSRPQALTQRLPFHERLVYQSSRRPAPPKSCTDRNVGVLERRGTPDLALEPPDADCRGQFRLEHLQGDVAPMPEIAREIGGGHPSAPEARARARTSHAGLAWTKVVSRQG
jgi:hypothetical protein